jgi:hypothetical protein
MVAPSEGIVPNFHDAFTQLHLGQLLASVKCTSGDRRDIDPNTDHIDRNSLSSCPSVDEDLVSPHLDDVVRTTDYMGVDSK